MEDSSEIEEVEVVNGPGRKIDPTEWPGRATFTSSYHERVSLVR